MSIPDQNDERSFFEKHGIAVVIGVIVLLVGGVGAGVYLFAGKVPAPKKPQEITVKLLPPPPLPPPPPPPPPKNPPPPEPKMVEQPKVDKPEPKPKQEAKIDHPPGNPGPKAAGPASDDGIGGTGGDGGLGDGGGGGSKYGWYAAQVQQAIAEALRKNGKTHDAVLHIKVRIWSDASGRVTRALLADSSGDSSVDDAIKNQVLTGLVLPEAPPADMPMPIVLRLNALRPN